MIPALTITDELSFARQRLDGGPLNARTLRAVEVLRTTSAHERMVQSASSYVASLVVSATIRGAVRFCEVSDVEDWRAVRELRMRSYPVSLPYLSNVIDADGSDRHDRHSFVYAAMSGGRAVATIRATAYPYESLDHLSAQALGGFLGAGWQTDYVELGRLLIDNECNGLRLAPALITYAGIRIMALTPYRKYFGYTKPGVRDMLSKFSIESETMRFTIPSRGSHHYLMTKGSLAGVAMREVPKWLGKVGGRLAGVDGAGAQP
jgi:hypothetical protein